MKKFIGMLLISSAIYSANIHLDIFGGTQVGNWRIVEGGLDGNLDGIASSMRIELSSEISPHMNFLVGGGYEFGFEFDKTKYDLSEIYLGGRFELNTIEEEKKWNPYIVGRIGTLSLHVEDYSDLKEGDYKGWAQMSLGLKYKKNFFIEVGYKQHILNYIPLDKDYDARFFSIDLGYRII